MKRKLLSVLISAIMPTVAWCADGDVFTAQTAEGISMEFRVISESEKTCQVGYGEDGNRMRHSIDNTYGGVITIPEKVNGYKVTAIAKWGFATCKITGIKIPESVSFIGVQAFGFTDNLKSITIPSSMTVINQSAFATCRGLTAVSIPTNVKTIEEGAFSSCNGLIEVTIPSSVTAVGSNAFGSCENLASVTFEGTIEDAGFHVFDNGNKVCGYGIFGSCPNLKTIRFGKNVTEIGNYLLAQCNALTSLTIPSHIKKIGASVISGENLESITIEGDLESMGEVSGEDIYASYRSWIGACPKLTTIIFANGVSKIADYALNSSPISKVSIAKSVKSIGTFAFANCQNLTSLSTSVETIGDYAFLNCTNLQSVTLLDGVANIGKEAFFQTKLTSVSFPASIQSIGDGAFRATKSWEPTVTTQSLRRHYIEGASTQCPHVK